jgi:hypothetical protein
LFNFPVLTDPEHAITRNPSLLSFPLFSTNDSDFVSDGTIVRWLEPREDSGIGTGSVMSQDAIDFIGAVLAATATAFPV